LRLSSQVLRRLAGSEWDTFADGSGVCCSRRPISPCYPEQFMIEKRDLLVIQAQWY